MGLVVSDKEDFTTALYPRRVVQETIEAERVSNSLVFLTSRWFPIILAVLQVARHVGFVGLDYWAAEQHQKRFDAGEFIRRDLARPLFEPYEFCGAYTRYSVLQSADLGLDLPAYLGATLLHTAVNAHGTCVDALMTPRGEIIVAAFVLPLWLWVGRGIRRLAKRRWRGRSTGRISRTFLRLCMISAPFAFAALLFSFASLLVSDSSVSVRLAGLAFWFFCLASWAAERLRLWPFSHIDTSSG